MEIAGLPFIEMEFDFEGKATEEEREEYVQDVRLVMETEYQKEIIDRGGAAIFYYHAKSRSDNMRITALDLRAFDIKLEQFRFAPLQKPMNGAAR